MAKGIDIQVSTEGLNELRLALNELDEKIAKRVLARAARKGAEVALEAVRNIAPVDTGLIRRSLRVTRGRLVTRRVAHAFVSIRKLSSRKVKEYVKRTGNKSGSNRDDPYYWRVLEFSKSNGKARSFILPGYHMSKYAAKDAIVNELKAGVEKETRKLYKRKAVPR